MSKTVNLTLTTEQLAYIVAILGESGTEQDVRLGFDTDFGGYTFNMLTDILEKAVPGCRSYNIEDHFRPTEKLIGAKE